MTTMIATCSVEKKNIDVSLHTYDCHMTCVYSMCCLIAFNMYINIFSCTLQETISTCRFAQRVALVKNEAMQNEELDPKLVRDMIVPTKAL